MNTFIISSKNLEKGIGESEKLIKGHKIDAFDIQKLEFEKALGIEDVRKIQEKIYLKPFKSEKKAVVIIMKNGATVDAQNSMLKLLEEPPTTTLIYLVTDNFQSFLPTILSRAKIIELREELETNIENLEKILTLDKTGDRLYLAQEVSKEKVDAIKWLEGAILAGREEMLKTSDKEEALKFRKLIHKLELTHYDLKTTNANPRLALENLFLNL